MTGIMKIDELLKNLENIKINDDKIIKRRQIAKILARMPDVNESPRIDPYYIMTRDGHIYNIGPYNNFLRVYKYLSEDAYVYVYVNDVHHPADYYFPFLIHPYLLP